MLNRFSAEDVLRQATGGARPSEGDFLVFTRQGWLFQASQWKGVLPVDPVSSSNGDYWFNSVDEKLKIKTAAGVFESSFTLSP